MVKELIDYFSHDHTSLFTRPKLQGLWGKPIPNEQICYFYQGVPGVGVVLAQNLAKIFPKPAGLVAASLDNLKDISHVGKQRAARIHKFLHEGVLK